MRSALLTLLFLTTATLPLTGAQAASDLEGTWSGGGYILPKSGVKESVRCRVRYDRQSKTAFRVTANCASSSTKVVQTGEVLEVSGGRYVGDFYNPQYDISGKVRVLVSGNSQTVNFSGAQGQSSLSLTKR